VVSDSPPQATWKRPTSSSRRSAVRASSVGGEPVELTRTEFDLLEAPRFVSTVRGVGYRMGSGS